MAKTVKATQAALTRARERRVALDAERDAQDQRIEQAAAEVFMLLGDRSEAEAKVTTANAGIRQALRRVLDEGIGVDAAAKLVDLEAVEVRRLTKPSAGEAPIGVEVVSPPRAANDGGSAVAAAG